ncbi:hypothetical protein [Paenibacillus taichungensis]
MSVLVFKGSRAKGNGDLRERGEAVSVLVFKGSRAKGNGDHRERGEAVSALSW